MENRAPMCPYMMKCPMYYSMSCPLMISPQAQYPCMMKPMISPTVRTMEDELEFEDDDDVTRAPDNVDVIVQKIESERPTVFNILKKHKLPYMVTKRIIRRIVYLTLLFDNKIK